jgi:hypothetical protein
MSRKRGTTFGGFRKNNSNYSLSLAFFFERGISEPQFAEVRISMYEDNGGVELNDRRSLREFEFERGVNILLYVVGFRWKNKLLSC